jgi:hypothetical protein
LLLSFSLSLTLFQSVARFLIAFRDYSFGRVG